MKRSIRSFIALPLALVLALEPAMADFGSRSLDFGFVGGVQSEIRNRHTTGGPSGSLADPQSEILAVQALSPMMRWFHALFFLPETLFQNTRRPQTEEKSTLAQQSRLSATARWIWKHRTAIYIGGLFAFIAVRTAMSHLGADVAVVTLQARYADMSSMVAAGLLLCRRPASKEFKDLTTTLDGLVASAPRMPAGSQHVELTEEEAVDRLSATDQVSAEQLGLIRENLKTYLDRQTPLPGAPKIMPRIFFVRPPDGGKVFTMGERRSVVHYSVKTGSIYIPIGALEDLQELTEDSDAYETATQELALHAWNHLTDQSRTGSRWVCRLDGKLEERLLLQTSEAGELEAPPLSQQDREALSALTQEVSLKATGTPRWLGPNFRELKRKGEGPSKEWIEAQMLEVARTHFRKRRLRQPSKPEPKDTAGFAPGELRKAFNAMGWHLHLTYYPFKKSRNAFNGGIRWGFVWVHEASKTRVQIGRELVVNFGYLTREEELRAESDYKTPIQQANFEEPYLLSCLSIIRQPRILQDLLAQPEFDAKHHRRERLALLGLARLTLGMHYPSTIPVLGQRVASTGPMGGSSRITKQTIDLTMDVLRRRADEGLDLGERKAIPTWLQIINARAALAQRQMQQGDIRGWWRLAALYARNLRLFAAFLTRTISYLRLFGLIKNARNAFGIGLPLDKVRNVAGAGDGPLIGAQAILELERPLAELGVDVNQIQYSAADAVLPALRIGEAAVAEAQKHKPADRRMQVTTHVRNVSDGLPWDTESQDVIVTGLLGSLGDGMSSVSLADGEIIPMDRRVYLLADLNRVLRPQGYAQLLVRRRLPKEVRQALSRFGFTVITERDAKLLYGPWTLMRLLQRRGKIKIIRAVFDRLRSRFYGSSHLVAVKTGKTLSDEDLRALAQDAALRDTLRAFVDLVDAQVPEERDPQDGQERRRQAQEVTWGRLAFNRVSTEEAAPTGISRQEIAALMVPGQTLERFRVSLAALIWGAGHDESESGMRRYLTDDEADRLANFIDIWNDSTELSLPREDIDWIMRRAKAEAFRRELSSPDRPAPAPVRKPAPDKPVVPPAPVSEKPRKGEGPSLLDVFEEALQRDPALIEQVQIPPPVPPLLLEPSPPDGQISENDGEPPIEGVADDVLPDLTPLPGGPVGDLPTFAMGDLPLPPQPPAHPGASPGSAVLPSPAPLTAQDLAPLFAYLVDCLNDGRWISPRWGRITDDLAQKGYKLPDDLLNKAREVQRVASRRQGEMPAYRALYDWIDELSETYLKQRGFMAASGDAGGLANRQGRSIRLVSLAKPEPIARHSVIGLAEGDQVTLYAMRDNMAVGSTAIRPLVHVVNDEVHRFRAGEIHSFLRSSAVSSARDWFVRAYRRLGFRPNMMARQSRRQQRIRVLMESVTDALAQRAYVARGEEDPRRKGWDRRTPPYARWSTIPFMEDIKEGFVRETLKGSKAYDNLPWPDYERSLMARDMFVLLNSLANAVDPAEEIAQWLVERSGESGSHFTLAQNWVLLLLVRQLDPNRLPALKESFQDIGPSVSDFLIENADQLQATSRQILEDNFTVRLEIDAEERIHVVKTFVEPPPAPFVPPAPPPQGLAEEKFPAKEPAPLPAEPPAPPAPPKTDPRVPRAEALADLTDFVRHSFENGHFDETAWHGIANKLADAGIPFTGTPGQKTDQAAAFAREGVPLQKRYLVLYDWLEAVNYVYLKPLGQWLVVKNNVPGDNWNCRMVPVRTSTSDQYTLLAPPIDSTRPQESLPFGIFQTSEHPLGSTDKTVGVLSHFSHGVLIWGNPQTLIDQSITNRLKFWPEVSTMKDRPNDVSENLRLVTMWMGRFSGQGTFEDMRKKQLESNRWSHMVVTIMGEQGKRLALADLESSNNSLDPSLDQLALEGNFYDYWEKQYLDPQSFLWVALARLRTPATSKPIPINITQIYESLSQLADGPQPAGKMAELVSFGLAAAEGRGRLDSGNIVSLYLIGSYLKPSHHWDLAAMLKSGTPDIEMVQLIARQLYVLPDDFLRQVGNDLLDDSFRFRIRRGTGQEIRMEETPQVVGDRSRLLIAREMGLLLEQVRSQGRTQPDQFALFVDYLRSLGGNVDPLLETLQKMRNPLPEAEFRWYLDRLARHLNDLYLGSHGNVTWVDLFDDGYATDWTPGLRRELPFHIEGEFQGEIPFYNFTGRTPLSEATYELRVSPSIGVIYAPLYSRMRAKEMVGKARGHIKKYNRVRPENMTGEIAKVIEAQTRWTHWLKKGFGSSNISENDYGDAYMNTSITFWLTEAMIHEWPDPLVVAQGLGHSLREQLLADKAEDLPELMFIATHLRPDSPFYAWIMPSSSALAIPGAERFSRHEAALTLLHLYSLLNCALNDLSPAREISNTFMDIHTAQISEQVCNISHAFRILTYLLLQQRSNLMHPALHNLSLSQLLDLPSTDARWNQISEEFLNMADKELRELVERILRRHYTARVRASLKDRKVRLEPLSESPVQAHEGESAGGGGVSPGRLPPLSDRLHQIFIREYREGLEHWHNAEQITSAKRIPDAQIRANVLANLEKGPERRQKTLRRVQESRFTRHFVGELLRNLRLSIEERNTFLSANPNSAFNDLSGVQMIVFEQMHRFLTEAAKREMEPVTRSESKSSDAPRKPAWGPLRDGIQRMIDLVHRQAPGLDPTLGHLYRDLLKEYQVLADADRAVDFFDHQSDTWRFLIRLGVLIREQRRFPWRDGTLNAADEEAACLTLLREARVLSTAVGVRDFDFEELFGIKDPDSALGASGLFYRLGIRNPVTIGKVEGTFQSLLGAWVFLHPAAQNSVHAFAAALVALFALHFFTGVVGRNGEKPVPFQFKDSGKATFTSLAGFMGWPLMALGLAASGPLHFALFAAGFIMGPVLHGKANGSSILKMQSLLKSA